MKRKGFLFSLDALLAFWLILTLSASLVVFTEQSPERGKWLSYNQLAHDYVVVNDKICGSNVLCTPLNIQTPFKTLTGFDAKKLGVAVVNGKTVVEGSAVLYAFTPACSGLVVAEGSPCLLTQDLPASKDVLIKPVLVGPK